MPQSIPRAVGLTAVLAGAVGSIGFLLHAARSPSLLLVVVMSAWVLSPFVALAGAGVVSKRWLPLTRATLSWLMLVLPLGSLAVYGADALDPPKAQRAFAFVMVPPVSWLLMAVAVTAAARVSSKRSHRSKTSSI